MTAQQCERIWAIHDEAAWKHFEQSGVMKGDGRRVIHDFRPAYYWIMEQMRQRIPGYGGGYPVWAWSRWKRRSHKPDPHECTRYPSGTQGVVVECEVPCDSILKSDHELWHIILSGQYLGASEEEEMEWEQRELSGNVAHDVLEQERRRSWGKIFDLTNNRGDPKWLGSANTCAVQAVIEKILLDQVRKVEWFTHAPRSLHRQVEEEWCRLTERCSVGLPVQGSLPAGRQARAMPQAVCEDAASVSWWSFTAR